MTNFDIAFRITISHEGGYSNNPADRGGETYKGISRKNWPEWDGWRFVDIYKSKYKNGALNAELEKNIGVQGLVKEFYKRNFWDSNYCELFDEDVSRELFDTSVNQGSYEAARALQRSLNKLNRNQQDYYDIHDDGFIGEKTLSAYRQYMSTSRFTTRNKEKLIKWLLRWMNYYQLKKYDAITDSDPGQEIFIPGWTERA